MARTGGREMYGVSLGNVKDRDHLEDMVVDGRIMLQLVFNKQDGWTVDWIAPA